MISNILVFKYQEILNFLVIYSLNNKLAQQIFSLEPKRVAFIETKFRKIKTFIPAPGTEEIFKRLSDVESRSMHGQLPIVWKKAKEFSIYDIAGNKWIDFTSTIFVTNIGHSNSKVSESIKETLDLIFKISFSKAMLLTSSFIKFFTLLSISPTKHTENLLFLSNIFAILRHLDPCPNPL